MHWLNEETLAPLFEVNQRLVELIWNGVTSPPLCLADMAVRKRLARCPFLLVDAGLSDPKEWPDIDPKSEGFFRRDEAVALARMTFVFAWSMARTHREASCIVLGISPVSAAFIAGLGLASLQALAEDRWWSIKPRWVDRPEVWRRLAVPGGHARNSPLGPTGLRAFQLLFWDHVQAVGC